MQRHKILKTFLNKNVFVRQMQHKKQIIKFRFNVIRCIRFVKA